MSCLFWHAGESGGWQSRPDDTIKLPATGAHVWFLTEFERADISGAVPAAEIARAQVMLPASKAQEFLVARARLRRLLAGFYLKEFSPQHIRIDMSKTGKPYLPDSFALHFNISHSYGALAIAVSRDEVGIDIEKIRPIPDWHELSQSFLAPTDTAAIASHAETDQSTAFLYRFTAREAYLKAVGTGFSSQQPAMDFHSGGTTPVTPDERGYVLAPLPPLPDFVGYVCVLDKSFT